MHTKVWSLSFMFKIIYVGRLTRILLSTLKIALMFIYLISTFQLTQVLAVREEHAWIHPEVIIVIANSHMLEWTANTKYMVRLLENGYFLIVLQHPRYHIQLYYRRQIPLLLSPQERHLHLMVSKRLNQSQNSRCRKER